MMIGTKRRNKHTRWHMAHASSSTSPSQPWNCGALYRECESLCQDSLCKVKAKTKIDLKTLACVLSLLSCSHVYAFKRRFYILLTSYRHQVLMKNYDYYSQYGQFNMRSFVTHLSLVLSFDLFLTDFYRWNVACVFDKSSMLRCIAMITCTCKIVRRSYAIF